jgi:catabolite regulation protein CreA
MQIIENDPIVKEIIADPKVKAVIDYMQRTGSLDLYEVMRKDQETGKKL